MEQDVEETLVVFRKYKKKHLSDLYKDTGRPEILALFPEIIEVPSKYLCSCYERLGQHGSADYHGCVHELTDPATPEEYAGLKEELESIGYKLKVREKWIRRKGWSWWTQKTNC
jgi:hypothetical protein